MQQKARLVAENLWFNVFFAVVIMSNSVFLGMQLEWSALRVDRPGGEEGSVLAMGGIEATWEETALILKIDVHRKKNWAWAIARVEGVRLGSGSACAALMIQPARTSAMFLWLFEAGGALSSLHHKIVLKEGRSSRLKSDCRDTLEQPSREFNQGFLPEPGDPWI